MHMDVHTCMRTVTFYTCMREYIHSYTYMNTYMHTRTLHSWHTHSGRYDSGINHENMCVYTHMHKKI
jgi:hypothetical protein